MKPLSKTNIVQLIILIMGTALVVKIVWFIIALTLLTANGVEYQKPSTSKALYYRTKFASEQIREQRPITPTISADTIKSIKLLAIYKDSSSVVVTVSKNGKSSVLLRGDEIDGYRLDDATAKEALFIRNTKLYRITLTESSSTNRATISYAKSSPKPITQPTNSSSEIVNIDGITTISRGLLEKYSQNMDDIWKNIGINEKKVDGTTIGFQVNFVKRGSDFAKLGLRRGDLILAVNGDKLDSYAKALELYGSVDTIENMTIRIKRGREEMELEYEIK